MTINSAAILYFSPTGTTKKISHAIIQAMNIEATKTINLTSPDVRNTRMNSIDEDILLIAIPVYAERVPEMVLPFLSNLTGNGKPVILVTVYGNIGDGMALDELYSIAKKAGFHVVGAGTFIGEHSFSTSEVPIAENRPNREDLAIAEEFGRHILKKLQNDDHADVVIPQGKMLFIANVLPKNSAKIFTKTPNVDRNLCNGCGACAKLCPMGAINKETLEINDMSCLRCFACVKKCPKKARKIVYHKKFVVSKFLKAKGKVHREPKIYV